MKNAKLSELLGQLREELLDAKWAGRGSDLRFQKQGIHTSAVGTRYWVADRGMTTTGRLYSTCMDIPFPEWHAMRQKIPARHAQTD